eukprot:5169853-Pleurochrysis_carterae.AAC.1
MEAPSALGAVSVCSIPAPMHDASTLTCRCPKFRPPAASAGRTSSCTLKLSSILIAAGVIWGKLREQLLLVCMPLAVH